MRERARDKGRLEDIMEYSDNVAMLNKAFKNAHPTTPWSTVQGMRHVLVHDYAGIDTKELYNTAMNGIPQLREQVKKYLDETDWDAWEAMPDDFVG